MELAALLSHFLLPFLPRLLNTGRYVSQDFDKGCTKEDRWLKAKHLWTQLAEPVNGRPRAKGAIAELVTNQENINALATLTQQLQKILAADSALAASIQHCLDDDVKLVSRIVNTTQTVAGDKNIVIGQTSGAVNDRHIQIQDNAIGSAIVSGDGNTIYVIQQTSERLSSEAEQLSAHNIGPNPYKGLAAFKETDAGRYFGREVQIKRLLQKFQALYEQSEMPRLLSIVGPSGCGKSSLVRAGFIPELARNPLIGKEHMRVAVMVPGTRPLEALAGVLAKAVTGDPFPAEKTEEFERVLTKPNEVGSAEGLRRIANLIPNIRDTPLVILVDQFEEVYSLCDDNDAEQRQQRQMFINNLLHAASEPTGEVSVVITLRSDFLSETQRHKQLNQAIGSDQSVIVPAMTTKELRSAISEPAKQAGYPLDGSTIDLLVKDTEGREGALPLLQFLLSRIWQGLVEGKTPIITYRETGGVGGALAGKAQDIYDRLSDSEQKIARRVFVGLVQLGEGTRDTRRRIRLKGLIAEGESLESIQKVIYQFSSLDARLITLSIDDGHEIAEVTHEALFEYWQQLKEWLHSSRDDIRFHRRLEDIARYWEEKGRPDGLLWQPPDLDLLQNYQQRVSQDMTEVETAFWKTSDRVEQRRKQTKRLVIGGLAIGFVLTSISTGFALWNVRLANSNSVKALAQSAATLRVSGNNFESVLMALRAKKRFENSWLIDPDTLNQVEESFYSSLFQKYYEVNRLESNSDEIQTVRFSPDGKTFVAASADGTAKLWKGDGSLIATLEGHSGVVNGVRFNPDGKTLVTASADRTAKLWKGDGSLIATLEGHSGAVNDVRFNPDGKTLVTASADGTAKLWKGDGSLIATLEGHSGAVNDVRFSPNGKTLATASSDGTVKLWKSDGSLITSLIEAGYGGGEDVMDFSPDSEIFVTAGGTAKLWTNDGRLIANLEGNSGLVWNVRFSPDGKTLVTAGGDGTAKLWASDGSLIADLEGNGAGVVAIRFSPDGQTIVTASNTDGMVKLWNSDGRPIATLEGHSDMVLGVRFGADGQTLATASTDGTVKIWRNDGRLIRTVEGTSVGFDVLDFSPDSQGTLITAGMDGTTKLLKSYDSLIATLEGHSDIVSYVRFSSGGTILGTVSVDGIVKLWKSDGSLIATLEGRSVDFRPDGGILVTVNGMVKLWKSDGSTVSIFADDNDKLVNAGFNGSKSLITVSENGIAKLWKSDGSLIATIEDNDSVLYAHSNSDGTILATVNISKKVKLWESDGSLVATLSHSDGVNDVDFSPDGETIATASSDGTTMLWRNDGRLIATLESHSDGVNDVDFSPDGETIATASWDGTTMLWRNDGRLIATLVGHSGVNDVDFSPDGETIATASWDGTTMLWRNDGRLIATLVGHSGVNDTGFSPDGKTLFTASSDGQVKLFPLGLDVLADYTCQNMRYYLLSSPNLSSEDKELCN